MAKAYMLRKYPHVDQPSAVLKSHEARHLVDFPYFGSLFPWPEHLAFVASHALVTDTSGVLL